MKIWKLSFKESKSKGEILRSRNELRSEIQDWIEYIDDEEKEWFNRIKLKPNSE